MRGKIGRSLIVLIALFLASGVPDWRMGTSPAVAQSGPGSSGSSAMSSNLRLVGNMGGSGGGLAIDGSTAFIGHGKRVLALDVSNPSSPRLVGQSPVLPHFVSDIEIVGSFLYVADELGGLRILARSNLQEAGFYPTPSMVFDVAIQSPYAYLAEKEGLRILDVSDPAAPRLIRFLYTSAIPIRISVSGRYAAVSYDFSGLIEIYDVTQPSNPVSLSQINVPGMIGGVWLSGSLLFAVNGVTSDQSLHGLRIFDLSNPRAPSQIGFVNLFAPVDLAIANNYAYVIDTFDRLFIVDISNPAAPRLVGQGIFSTGLNNKIRVAGQVAYVMQASRLVIISVANPSSPQQLGSYALSGPRIGVFQSIYAFGPYAYLTDRDGFRVIDLSMPAQPRSVGFLAPPPLRSFSRFSIDGSYAFIAGGGTLAVVDISNPYAPRLVREAIPNSGYMDAIDVAVRGNYVFVTSLGECGIGTGLLVFERVNPDYPVHIASVPGTGRSLGVFVASMGGRVYAYLADACGALHVVDVSAPNAPSRIASLSLPSAHDVFVIGIYAYVATDDGVRVIDVSNPAAPRQIGAYPLRHALGIYGHGSNVYVATGLDGLHVLDVSSPAVPQEIAYARSDSGADLIFADDRYILWGDGRTGLNILSLTAGGPGPINHPPSARIRMCADSNCRREGERLEMVVPSGQTATVRLSGAESTDPDGDVLTYRWTVDGGPAGSGQELTVSLSPREQEYEIRLTVEDGRGGRGEAAGRIAVLVSGSDGAQLVPPRHGLVTGSTVPPGEALTHMWRFKNTGNTTWDPSTHFLERVEGTVGPDRIALPRQVAPGGSELFVWQAQAPSSPGSYTVAYQMRGPRGRFGPVTRLRFYVAQADANYGQTVLNEASKLAGMEYSPLLYGRRAMPMSGSEPINTPTDYFARQSEITPSHKLYYSGLGGYYFRYGVCTDVPIDGAYFGLNKDLAKATGWGARNTDCLMNLLRGSGCGGKTLTDILGASYRYMAWEWLSPAGLEQYVKARPGDLIFFKWKQGAWGERWDPNRDSHHVGIVRTVTADGRPDWILDNGAGLGSRKWDYFKGKTEWVHLVRVVRVSGAAGLGAAGPEAAQAGEEEPPPYRLVLTLEGAGARMEIRDEMGRFVPRSPDPSVLAVHEHNWIPYVPARTEWTEVGSAQIVTLTASEEMGAHYAVRLIAGAPASYRLQARLLRGDQLLATAEQVNPIGAENLMVHLDIGPTEEGFRMQMTPPMPAARLIVPEEVFGSAMSGVARLELPIRADPAWGTARKVRLAITDLRYGFFDSLPPERIRLPQEPVDLGPGETWIGWVEVDVTGIPPGHYVGRVVVSADNGLPESVSVAVEARGEHRLYLPLVLRGP